VKLLDFGIAKLLDPALVDASGQSIANPTVANAMTPAYASPEQIKGEPITTASDVYALGVLLYRLLTGKSPYKNDTTHPLELAKEIVDTDPERPSTIVTRGDSMRPTERSVDTQKVVRTLDTKRLRRELSGDLDNIVLMALRKDAARRYASAEQLGDDIARHLADLPVRARADTWGYRSQKFLSRNRWSAGFVALGCMGLIGGIAATSYQAKLAREAQARSETLFADVRKLANSYLFEVHDAVKNLPGATPVREMLVKNSIAYLDRLSRDASDAPGLIAEIASGYDKLGDVQGAWRAANLGDTKGAEVSFRKAIALRERALVQLSKAATSDERIAVQRLLIVNYGKLSELLVSNGRVDEGLIEGERALRLSESLAQQPGATVTDQLNVARGQFSMASQRISRGALSDAGDELNASLAKLTALQRTYPADKLLWRVGAAMQNQAGVVYLQNGALVRAKTAFAEALRLTELSLQTDPGTPQFERMKMLVGLQYAEARFRAGELSLDAVFAEQEQAIALAQTLARADPKNQRYAIDVALVRQWVADKLTKQRDFDQALRLLSESENELVALTKQVTDSTALANLGGVRLQTQYVAALFVAEQRHERSKLARLCARLIEQASDTKQWGTVMNEGRPEANLLMPSKMLFQNATDAARAACSVVKR
jgi:eukaryotic-like serine/threonine-protein kinase